MPSRYRERLIPPKRLDGSDSPSVLEGSVQGRLYPGRLRRSNRRSPLVRILMIRPQDALPQTSSSGAPRTSPPRLRGWHRFWASSSRRNDQRSADKLWCCKRDRLPVLGKQPSCLWPASLPPLPGGSQPPQTVCRGASSGGHQPEEAEQAVQSVSGSKVETRTLAESHLKCFSNLSNSDANLSKFSPSISSARLNWCGDGAEASLRCVQD
jgi:hypothetical protein